MHVLKSLILASLLAIITLAPPPAWAQGEEDLADDDLWVTGNLTFMAYHEVGHLILDQVYRADQTVNPRVWEQTADDIATWLLSPDPDTVDDYDETIVAIEGWLESEQDRAAEGQGPWDDPHYPDDATRAARIACLLHGSDAMPPNTFDPLLDVITRVYNPAGCAPLYDKLNAQLEQVFGDTDVTKDNPVAQVYIRYDPPSAGLTEAANFLSQSGILEDLRADLIASVGRPIAVMLLAAPCGADSPGFRYSPALRQITACYEEVDWFLYGPDARTGTASDGATIVGDELGARRRQQAPRTPSKPPPAPRG